MKRYFTIPAIAIALALGISITVITKKTQAQSNTETTGAMIANSTEMNTNHQWQSVFLTNMPSGYRDWKLISVAREEGKLDDIRAILGNDLAIKAYREGTLPFPEGAIIARVAWSYDVSEENNKTFGKAQSFVAGAPKNGVQFMIKDSKKYAATGGWGYGHFNDGKPADEVFMQSCYPCHKAIEFRDFVFARYAP